MQGLGKPKSLPHRSKGPKGAARQAEQQRKAAERKKKKALRAREHESREKEVAKLIREGMDPAEALDLVDARPLEYPESGSDGEEEEKVPEPLGGEDSSFDVSPCETSGSGALKGARDMEPESVKRLRGEGSGA